MSLRRIVADLIDPGRLLEVRELRENARKAHERRASVEIAWLKDRTTHAAEIAVVDALRHAAELEANTARADVARLLEDAARCAHHTH